MAKASFRKGDIFCSTLGHGVVLDNKKVLLIAGKGGRSGWQTEKTNLPPDAVHDTLEGMHFEKRLALEAVQTAIA